MLSRQNCVQKFVTFLRVSMRARVPQNRHIPILYYARHTYALAVRLHAFVTSSRIPPMATHPIQKPPLFDARKILSRCPPKYQNPPHRSNVEAVLRLLRSHQEGLYQNDIVDSCGLNRNHCIEYLNMLLRIGDCVRENRKVSVL